jgi:hypothetical protein
MRLFSEKVKPTLTNSAFNIIQVENYDEIFFGVYEIEINENKYPVEKVSEFDGNPVVSIPVEVKGEKTNYPFVLSKGSFDVFFNEKSIPTELMNFSENSSNDRKNSNDLAIFSEEDIYEELIDNKERILDEIKNAKLKALKAVNENIRSKNRKNKKEQERKEKQLKSYLESARDNLVDEFLSISKKIKNELIDSNDQRFSEISESLDIKIEVLSNDLLKSLNEDFKNASSEFDFSIRSLVKELYNTKVNTKLDKELENISNQIIDKVTTIEVNLENKLKDKAEVSLLENLNKEIDVIRDSNIELNNNFNKGVNKALSRVGNVDRKIKNSVLSISKEIDNKIKTTEKKINNFYGNRLELLESRAFKITEETRKYFLSLISESRDNLINEIRETKNEKPIEIIFESSGKKEVKDFQSIQKDIDKKINDKIENEVTRLRKYISLYSGGGGSVAQQFAAGGIMNGDLIVNGNANIYDVTTNKLIFDVNTFLPLTETGQLAWNADDGTLQLGLQGNNTTLKIGQEEIIRVLNKTNTNLLKSQYKVARVRSKLEGGPLNQKLSIILAKGDEHITQDTILGIVNSDIPINEEGYIQTSGIIENINSTGSHQGETWHNGDILYLSNSVLGGITNVKPTSPQNTIVIGYVVYTNISEGKIFIRIDKGYQLNDINDIKIDNPQNNNVLIYNSSLSVWENKPSSLGSGYLSLSGGTIEGNLVVTNTISASNNIFSGAYDSSQWTSTYTTVQANSGSWGNSNISDRVDALYSYLVQNLDKNRIVMGSNIDDFIANYWSPIYDVGDVITLSAANIAYLLGNSDGSNQSDWFTINLKPNFLFFRTNLPDNSILDSFKLSDSKSAKYIIQVEDKETNDILYGEVNLVSNGVIAVTTEYGLNHTTEFPFVEFGGGVIDDSVGIYAVASEGHNMQNFIFKGNRVNLFS